MFETGFTRDRFPEVPTPVVKRRITEGLARKHQTFLVSLPPKALPPAALLAVPSPSSKLLPRPSLSFTLPIHYPSSNPPYTILLSSTLPPPQRNPYPSKLLRARRRSHRYSAPRDVGCHHQCQVGQPTLEQQLVAIALSQGGPRPVRWNSRTSHSCGIYAIFNTLPLVRQQGAVVGRCRSQGIML